MGRLLRVSRLGSGASHGFDLFVDGVRISSASNSDGAETAGALIDEDYEIPIVLSVGKDELIVRVVAPEGMTSGRIHALRLLAAEKEG